MSDASVASLGCYKDDVCNSRISKISILNANPWSLPVSKKIFLYFFFNKLPFWRPFCLHFHFFYFVRSFVSLTRFQLHSLQFKGKMWVETFFSISHHISLIIDLHLERHHGYIEMLNDARVASLGFSKDSVCTTRINKEKKFKIKFQAS